MTRLWIDGQEAVLPESFTIQVKRENPFFTKNGEYTYDITLSLLNSVNATLYSHLNRLNSLTEVKSKRKAKLVADNRVYCDGTEIVTGWTEKEVTIQIAGGNSEFNYLLGNDLKMETLQLTSDRLASETLEMKTEEGCFRHIDELWPDTMYCLPAVGNPDSDFVYNDWGVALGESRPLGPLLLYVQQPWLMEYIRLVVQAIGYTLKLNQLEDTPYRYLYVLNGNAHNNDWGSILKGWTVAEFFEQIEKMFNASVVVNNRTKELSIVMKTRYYYTGECSHVRLAEDAYEVDCPETPDVEDPKLMNVGYNASGDWWDWAALDEKVMNLAKRVEIPADYPDGPYVRPYYFFLQPENQKKDTLYIDPTNGRQYLFIGEPYSSNNDAIYGFENDPVVRYRLVNEMQATDHGEDADDYTLDVQPAQMVWRHTIRDHHFDKHMMLSVPLLPFLVTPYGDHAESEEEIDLGGIVAGSSTANEEEKREFCLAFYDGLKVLDNYDGVEMLYPLSYVSGTRELPGRLVLSYRDSNDIGASLAPQALHDTLYSGGYDIDYLKEMKLKSYDPNVFDPTTLFEVNNKRYVCKEIEYTLDANGRKGAWTATLYPIRISDTEAESRWILTDGKWRDGGVWIDNGRWLDE